MIGGTVIGKVGPLSIVDVDSGPCECKDCLAAIVYAQRLTALPASGRGGRVLQRWPTPATPGALWAVCESTAARVACVRYVLDVDGACTVTWIEVTAHWQGEGIASGLLRRLRELRPVLRFKPAALDVYGQHWCEHYAAKHELTVAA